MPENFNLLESDWIPVLFEGEPKSRDVSIREALARAPDIIKLGNESPLETIAMHRLLLALVHRTHPIASDDDWAALMSAGRFDLAGLDEYLERWADRFDLFGADHPFFQTPGLPASVATSVAKLGHQFSSGNNPLLFDHSADDAPPGITPAQAARLVVAQQSFAVGGLITRLKADPPSAEASYLLKAAVVLVTGRNLFDTLVLNMVRVAGDEGVPFEFKPEEDVPAWEQGPPEAKRRKILGYLDLLTWQSRRIQLLPPEADGLVRQVVVMAGWQLNDGVNPADFETMAAYTKNEKAAAGQNPRPPVGFRPERALWRDSLALLQQTTDGGRPRTLVHLAGLEFSGYLERSDVVGLATYGVSSDRAKIFLWREEAFPLPLAYLVDDSLLATLGSGVESARVAGGQLRSAVRVLSEKSLAPDGNADKDRVTALVESLAPERSYWPALDLPFRRFIRRLADEYASDGGRAALEAWGDEIRRAATDSYELAAAALATSGRGYRAAAESAGLFHAGIRRATELLLEGVS